MVIENEILSAVIDLHGAELTSLKKQESGEELIWNADKEYWGRHAPMLFPIVGKVWNGEYRVGDKTYRISQHGFARDLDFKVLCHDGNNLTLALESDSATLNVYPYHFRIEATYSLEDNVLNVEWCIKNSGTEPMYFQIGAHPGFNYRDFCKDDFIHGFFRLTQAEEPVRRLIVGQLTSEGYRSGQAVLLELDSDAMLPITPGLFANDALVLEEHQIDQVILYDKDCNPYVAVETQNAPVWGLWSPPSKNAPFVCIEPWLGRCDSDGYTGDIADRDYMNRLEPGRSKEFSFRITVV